MSRIANIDRRIIYLLLIAVISLALKADRPCHQGLS